MGLMNEVQARQAIVDAGTVLYKQGYEMFEDEGYDVTTDECNPSELDGYLTRGSYDFIAYSSPIGDDTHGVPAFSAMGLITGLGEDEFKEEALEALHAAGK